MQASNFAVKTINHSLCSREDIDRFYQESVFLKELNHPNIVSYIDFIQEEWQSFLVMEYIDGGDLKNYIKIQNGQAIPEQQILNIFK